MNFGLLWIDALLISLLWIMTLAACIGRLKRKRLRWLLNGLCAAVPALLLGGFAFAAAEMKFVAPVEPGWFGYALALFLTFILTASLILWRANRREPGFAPASASWRRAPLALAFLGAIAVGYITLLNMDVALRARCAILSVEINSIYLATLPAITTDAQNAAPFYETAFARLRADAEQEEKVQNPPTGNDDNFDPEEPATIAFLEKEAATIALLRRAAALPACRFDQDLAVPDINAMMLHLNECRNAGNILNLDAREELARGHNASAIADAAAILGMSRHFGQRPLLISALVGAGLDALSVRTLESALPAVTSPDELAALHLDELPSMGRVFQQAMRGEERYGLLLYGDFPPNTSKDLKNREFQSQHTLLMSARGGLGHDFSRIHPRFGCVHGTHAKPSGCRPKAILPRSRPNQACVWIRSQQRRAYIHPRSLALTRLYDSGDKRS